MGKRENMSTGGRKVGEIMSGRGEEWERPLIKNSSSLWDEFKACAWPGEVKEGHLDARDEAFSSPSPSPAHPPLHPLKRAGSTGWDQGRHSLDFLDLRAEVKYIHGTFQSTSFLIRCFLPREAKDAEKRASL